jgi:hypothetical protein
MGRHVAKMGIAGGGARGDRHGLDGDLRDDHPESPLEVALRYDWGSQYTADRID